MNNLSQDSELIANQNHLIHNALMNPTHIRHIDKPIHLLSPGDVSFTDVANIFHLTASNFSVQLPSTPIQIIGSFVRTDTTLNKIQSD